MKSIATIYRIGPGPSSSHTLALKRACECFKTHVSSIHSIHATLVGSLALTGKGHFSDEIIRSCFKPLDCPVDFKLEWDQSYPHGFILDASNDHGHIIWHIFSIGGGAFEVAEHPELNEKEIYDLSTLSAINQICEQKGWQYLDYIHSVEADLDQPLNEALDAMLASVDRGLTKTGYLRGKLNVNRCAMGLYDQAIKCKDLKETVDLKLMAYAFAAAEENADGKVVVTAPTLGSCGVMAALMMYASHDLKMERTTLINGLKVAGLFGNIARENASVSGAIGGCQAEIGVACAMAAAGYSAMLGCDNRVVETSAEIAMEHHLGLTCDPVDGYVIIPCIERNSQAILRALDASLLARNIVALRQNKVSFDAVIDTMRYTGSMLPKELKETSLGGLATVIGQTNGDTLCHQ